MNQISQSDWAPLPAQEQQSEVIAAAPVSQLRETLDQFCRRKTAILGVVLVLLTILFGMIVPIACGAAMVLWG